MNSTERFSLNKLSEIFAAILNWSVNWDKNMRIKKISSNKYTYINIEWYQYVMKSGLTIQLRKHTLPFICNVGVKTERTKSTDKTTISKTSLFP